MLETGNVSFHFNIATHLSAHNEQVVGLSMESGIRFVVGFSVGAGLGLAWVQHWVSLWGRLWEEEPPRALAWEWASDFCGSSGGCLWGVAVREGAAVRFSVGVGGGSIMGVVVGVSARASVKAGTTAGSSMGVVVDFFVRAPVGFSMGASVCSLVGARAGSTPTIIVLQVEPRDCVSCGQNSF